MEGVQFISCVRFSIQLFITECFFILSWKKRNHFLARVFFSFIVYFFLSWMVFGVAVSIPGTHPIIYMIYYSALFCLTLGMMKFCFDIGTKEILFAGVCGYATQHLAFAVSTIMRELTGIELGMAADFIFLRCLPYVLAGAMIYFLLIRRYEGRSELRDRDMRMVGLALMILLTVIFISVLADSRIFQENPAFLSNVICKIYAVVCCLLSIFVAFSLSRQNRIIHENEMMEDMLHSLREQQKLSRENINLINIKCHDLNYRISRISKIENQEEQKEYIESIKNAVAIYDNIYRTGNDALDLVLTEKSLLCDEYHIKMSSMIDGSVLDFIHTTDVYALFGNLLDNAIESVLKEVDEEKRIISILIAKKNQGYHIHIDNYCSEEIQFEDGLPLTTKKDKDYHGFGVRSIRYIVEKYKGDILMRAADQRFQVDILFYS